jgi:hypothetical protein
MPARELADRKRRLVNEVNSYIALKKGYGSTETSRGELLAGAAEEAGETNNYDGKLELLIEMTDLHVYKCTTAGLLAIRLHL